MRQALASGIRLDGRKPYEFREMHFYLDPEQRGQVTVTRKTARVVASVTASLVKPFPDRPAEGSINFYLQISPTTAPELPDYEDQLGDSGNRWADEEARLHRLLERILRAPRIVDLESLCVVPGQKVWAIRVEVRVVAGMAGGITRRDGGAMADMVVGASVAALFDFRRPETSVEEDGTVRIFSAFERHPVPLTLLHPPLAVSLGWINVEEKRPMSGFTSETPSTTAAADATMGSEERLILVADPMALEERLGAQLVVGMNRMGELVTWVKSGGEAIDVDVLTDEALVLARSRVVSLLDAIKVAVATRK